MKTVRMSTLDPARAHIAELKSRPHCWIERMSGGGVVLIVEDDDDIREALADVVSAAGCRPAQVRNGAEALYWLKENDERPCVILLDLMMPVMDGWRFREVQASDPAIAEIPVIVTSTAYDPPSGVAAHLQKPVKVDVLFEWLENICRCAAKAANT